MFEIRFFHTEEWRKNTKFFIASLSLRSELSNLRDATSPDEIETDEVIK